MKNLQLKFLTNKEAIRWLTILNILERGRVWTSQQISDQTSISSRTVIKEIQAIRDYFGETIELETSNAGYVFKEREYTKYSSLKRQLVESDPLFIILNSILIGELQSIEEWAFHFHLSESTMKRHFLSVIPILKEYDIHLSLTPVDFVGKEVNIRKFFKDFYYEVEITPHTLVPFEEVQEVINYLEKEIRENLETNILPADFRYFLYIMIHRSKKKKVVPEVLLTVPYTQREQRFLELLKEDIVKIYGHSLSENELNILFIYLVSYRTIIHTESEYQYCNRFQDSTRESTLTKKFIERYDTELFKKRIPEEAWVFLEAFFISIRLLDKLGSIMNKTSPNIIEFCQQNYPKEYSFTLNFFMSNYHEMNIEEAYLEDLSASLVLTVEAVRDIHVRNARKIAFLLEGSYYVVRLIEAKVYRYLRGYHKIFFPTIEELTPKYFRKNQIDLLVTNHEDHITDLIQDIDYLIFKTIPDGEDWNRLLNQINPQITRDFRICRTLLIEK